MKMADKDGSVRRAGDREELGVNMMIRRLEVGNYKIVMKV